MGYQRVPRSAFNRGKISRLGLARTDVKRAELTAEIQTNWMPRVLGSMMLRPGWKYLGSTLSDSQAFLIPFVKSTDDTAFLEFTNESLRVWEDDAPIQRNGVTTTVRGGDFSADITNFNKLTDPSPLPGGNAQACAFTPDGTFFGVAHTGASSDGTHFNASVYAVSGTTFTTLTACLNTNPNGNGRAIAFSTDSQLMAIGFDTNSPFFTLYYRTGDGVSATWTSLSAPGSVPTGVVNGLSFSPDGQFLAAAHDTSPFVTVYRISGTGSGATLAKLTNPATLPASNGNGVAFSWNGRFMAVAHDTTPFVTVYDINADTLTALTAPASLPASTGNGVDFSRDGNWMSVAHDTTPFITIYAVSSSTFTKQTNPATLPDGNGQSCAFSSDNQFLNVAHTTTQFLTLYRNVSGTWTKQTDPGTLPDGNGTGTAWSWDDHFLATVHATTQFVTIYEAYQWLDMDASGAASTYANGSSGAFVQSSAWTAGAASGFGWNGYTFRQIVASDQLSRTGTKVKVSFKATTANAFSIDACYIGRQATSGDAYDFNSAPTQVTFNGGSAGFSILTTTAISSDEITFSVDETLNYIISWHVTSNQNNWSSVTNAGSCLCYNKSGVNEAATVNVSGYTNFSATKEVVGISKIEVFEVTTTSGAPGLSFVGTNYNNARRIEAVTVLNADKTVEHGIRVIVTRGLLNFQVGTTFGADDLVTKRLLGIGEYSFAFTPNSNLFFVEVSANTQYATILSSIQIDGDNDLTIPTPYSDDDLRNIRFAQSGDVIYLACQDIAQYKILRFASHSWGVAQYLPEDGPFRNENTDFTTLTASALNGDITITASKDYFKPTMVGGLFRIRSVGQATQDSFTGANQFSSAIKVTGVETSRDITIVRSGTWVATITLQRSVGAPGTWVDVATFTTNGTATYNDALDNQIIYYRIGIKTSNYTSGTAVVALSYANGSKDGIARLTGYTSAMSVGAIVLSPMGGTTAFETWAEGIWSDYRGWPGSVALYEGRLGWAGMDRIILSESDGYENFDDTVEGDSGPIIRTVGEGPVDDIHWLLPLQRLLAGAEGSELSIRSNSFDEPLTPSNYNMKACSTQGSAPVAAVKIDSNGAFTERSTTRVYQLLYNFDTYDYTSSDLTRLVPDMCEAGIVKIVLQRHPDTRLHCILADGTVAVLIFEPDEDVICWIDIVTDGLVEDVVVLPQQELEDAVYYVVNRTINGVERRYVEKWALESECVGGTISKCADSFLDYSGVSTATITGLTHLEGESVVVWGAGLDLGTYTVSGGSITLSQAVTSATVGLTYTADYESCKLAYAAQTGTALNARKAIAGVGIIATDMHHLGLKYGDSFSFLRGLPQVYRGKDVATGTVHTNFDDDLIPINREWGTDTRLCLRAVAPRPCTLLCVTMAMDTNA